MLSKKGTDDCIAYCKKDGDFAEAGTPVLTSKRAEGILSLLGELQDLTLENAPEPIREVYMSIIDDCAMHAFALLAYFDPDNATLQSDDFDVILEEDEDDINDDDDDDDMDIIEMPPCKRFKSI